MTTPIDSNTGTEALFAVEKVLNREGFRARIREGQRLERLKYADMTATERATFDRSRFIYREITKAIAPVFGGEVTPAVEALGAYIMLTLTREADRTLALPVTHLLRIVCDRQGEDGLYEVGDIRKVDGTEFSDEDIALIEKVWEENKSGQNDDDGFYTLLEAHHPQFATDTVHTHTRTLKVD